MTLDGDPHREELFVGDEGITEGREVEGGRGVKREREEGGGDISAMLL